MTSIIKHFLLLAFSSHIFQITVASAANKLDQLWNSILQNHIAVESKGAAGELAVVTRFKPAVGNEEIMAECSVCLCEIEEGEEIRELGCHHHFHRVCFDRWAGYGRRVTCPLCRRPVAPAGKILAENGDNVVFLKFPCLSNSEHRSSWWLR